MKLAKILLILSAIGVVICYWQWVLLAAALAFIAIFALALLSSASDLVRSSPGLAATLLLLWLGHDSCGKDE